LKQEIENRIREANREIISGRLLAGHLGHAVIRQRPGYPVESLVYAAVKEASLAAKRSDNLDELIQCRELKQILDTRAVSMVYQPIVSLKTGGIFAYEALAGGPAGSNFESPQHLFGAAEKFGCLFELESICRELAIINARDRIGERYLFINVSPQVLNTSGHKKGYTRGVLREYGLDFSKVVLELTERTAIEDYCSLREALSYYRGQGFYVAIDDAGAGYSSLQAIAELQPEFVKIDMSLVRAAHHGKIGGQPQSGV
jgi:EAL domain-containing protein (putative c-di-GMP-specific phosphodiesterase class I)